MPSDQQRVRHARDAAVAADVGGDALERHDGGGAGVLGDLRLLGVDDVHDDAALQHLGQAGLHPERRFVTHAHRYDVVRHSEAGAASLTVSRSRQAASARSGVT